MEFNPLCLDSVRAFPNFPTGENVRSIDQLDMEVDGTGFTSADEFRIRVLDRLIARFRPVADALEHRDGTAEVLLWHQDIQVAEHPRATIGVMIEEQRQSALQDRDG